MDDERAAKAARAKAMLKKHQAKKAGKPSPLGPGESFSPSTQSPAVSPPPSEVPADEYSNVPMNHSEPPRRASLTSSPPPRIHASITSATNPPSRPITPAPPVEDVNTQLRNLIQTQQQTISLLVSEKSSLTASLERLEGIEAEAQHTAELLKSQTQEIGTLRSGVNSLQAVASASQLKVDEFSASNHTLSEKCRDQERQLEITKRTVTDLRSKLEHSENRVRELEERIQSDDRVELLENSLRTIQDRADSLEFQLSKTKQTLGKTKAERDDFEERVRVLVASELEWKNKHTALAIDNEDLASQVSTVKTERDSLTAVKTKLDSQLRTTQASLAELQARASQMSTQLSSTMRQFEVTQSDLVVANRRADNAEKSLKELQNENVQLMASLNEMRPKLVELTDTKLDLSEKVERLEINLRSHESMVAQLEAALDEAKSRHDEAEANWRAIESAREKTKEIEEKDVADMESAYARLEEELRSALASVRELEMERTIHRQDFIRQQSEFDRLSNSAQTAMRQVSDLQGEVEERGREAEETKLILKDAQTEIEALRIEVESLQGQIASQQDEVVRLREVVSRPPSTSLMPRSNQTLNEEMQMDMEQRYQLELSNLRSQIRHLETELFDEQQQVGALQSELTQIRALVPQKFSHYSGKPSTVGFSRNHPDALDRRTSFGSTIAPDPHSPPPPPLPSRSTIDSNLPPDMRHKRRVSLSMLKARIDGELSGASPRAALKKELTSMVEESLPEGNEVDEGQYNNKMSKFRSRTFRRPQFLDESHVFWCHSCRGDLVVL